MDVVVVLEFCLQEELILVIALIVKESEVLFQFLIDMFSLAVRLQIVGSEGVKLHTEKLLSKFHNELWILVKHVHVGEAIKLPDVFLIQVGSTHCIACHVDQDEIGTLTAEVNNHHNSIIPMCIHKFYNKAHRGHTPAFHRHW